MARLNKLKCPVCKGGTVEKFWATPGYKLSKCLNCKLVWDPFPLNNVLGQYEENYFINDNPKGGYANYFAGMQINKRTFEHRLKKIKQRYGKGKLLDVGCALGDCLEIAKKNGWSNVEGVEVSKYAAGIARKKGLKVKNTTLEKSGFKENSFDVVTYQDVIEHLTDPLDELERIYKILKTGGVVFLVTPDVGGWWSRILGPLWYHYKPHEHLVYFSKDAIYFAMKKAGFENIRIKKTYHVLSLEYILSRLKYYQPGMFELILKIIGRTPFKNIPFIAYTGELEAWGEKQA
jgi:2-polyprenyl-3-methyl-5-hydroxy-6-metoxy-1,4-benzoquinol methylase